MGHRQSNDVEAIPFLSLYCIVTLMVWSPQAVLQILPQILVMVFCRKPESI